MIARAGGEDQGAPGPGRKRFGEVWLVWGAFSGPMDDMSRHGLQDTRF